MTIARPEARSPRMSAGSPPKKRLVQLKPKNHL